MVNTFRWFCKRQTAVERWDTNRSTIKGKKRNNACQFAIIHSIVTLIYTNGKQCNVDHYSFNSDSTNPAQKKA